MASLERLRVRWTGAVRWCLKQLLSERLDLLPLHWPRNHCWVHTDWISLFSNLILLANGSLNSVIRSDLLITAHFPPHPTSLLESSVHLHHQNAPVMQDSCHFLDIMHRFLPLGPFWLLYLILLFPPLLCFHSPRVWLNLCLIQDVFVTTSCPNRGKHLLIPKPKVFVCFSNASKNILPFYCVFTQLISPTWSLAWGWMDIFFLQLPLKWGTSLSHRLSRWLSLPFTKPGSPLEGQGQEDSSMSSRQD